MTTESFQQKQCLSEEADELWLQQMSYRHCGDMGSFLTITHTFQFLNLLVCEVTSFPGLECLLNHWDMICS